ncbi:MAG TPA: PfkB family carbohydrate kinase [Solirubrobacteraceae bacterium]|nr:PfkB family carbohydrate kinase [Solirubrobacteraceae bacterium]
MRIAVVGHVEWVEFAAVEHVPSAGEIVHASDSWTEAAGGGAVAAVQIARLTGSASFFTALAADPHGEAAEAQLTRQGVRVHAAKREPPHRRAVTFLDAQGERTITVIGPRIVPLASDPLPWDQLAAMDGVYFTGGDAGALRAARGARVLVATPRARESLARAGVELDALVHSAGDIHERYRHGDFEPAPRLVVTTEGPAGGSFVASDGRSGRWAAAPLPGSRGDSYGCGDSFAAGLTCGLAAGQSVDEALALAARCGAACLSGRGPYAGRLPVLT